MLLAAAITALDLTRIDLATVKRCFSVVLERTVRDFKASPESA